MAEAVVDESDRPGGPRSRKGIRTRARLLEAAKQIFEEQGFLDARVSDVAERAGLSHGSFYHYFECKEEVFLEVAQAQEERMGVGWLANGALPLTDADIDTADLVARACREFLVRYQADARIMGVIEQVSRYHEDFRQARTIRETRSTEMACNGLRMLQEAGRADPDLDPWVAGPALMGMVTHFAEMWLVQGTVECTLDEAVDNLTSLLVNSLGRAHDPDPSG
ncbi:MAG TPA: TetR/AcrR family transcriptional regulator [Acidimicrobiales bacterium]